MNRVTQYLTLLCCLLWSTPAWTHEDWITVSQYFPALGTEVQVFLGNGHRFPHSESAPSTEFVTGIEVTAPSGRQTVLPVHLDGANHQLRSSLNIQEAGTYLLSYTVQRPKMKEPLLLGRTVLFAGGDSGRYTQGKSLEIVPLTPLSSLQKGGTLPLALLFHGEAIAGSFTITPEGSRSYTMSSTVERPALIHLNSSGKYLVTTNRRGQYANFSFFVR
jgi:uncharacterized GH25 family protein